MVLGSKETATNSEETKLDAEEDHGIKSLGTGTRRSTGEDQSQSGRKPSAEGAKGHWMAPGISAQNPRDLGWHLAYQQNLSRVCFLF